MAENYKAVGSLKYNIEVSSAKAITQINNVKRSIRDLNKDYDYQAAQLKSLGRYEEAHRRNLKMSKDAYDQLDYAVKDMVRQIEKENALENKTTEQKNKIRHQLNDLINLRTQYSNTVDMERKKLILYNDELKRTNDKYENSVKFGNDRVKSLQAQGREEDALIAKTKAYGNQLDLLNNKQREQQNALKKYEDLVKSSFKGSDYDLSRKLGNDQDYQRLRRNLSQTSTKIAETQKAVKDSAKDISLYSKTLKDVDKQLDINQRAYNDRIRTLQAVGRQEDALREKGKSYGDQIDLLNKKQAAQREVLAKYQDQLRDGFNGSDEAFKRFLSHDETFNHLNSEINRTGNSIKRTKNKLDIYSTGLEEAKANAQSYRATTKSLTDVIKQQTGAISASRTALKRMSTQRELDMKQIDAQVAKMKVIKQVSGENSRAYEKERQELNKLSATFAANGKKEKATSGVFNPVNFSSKDTAAIDSYNEKAAKFDKAGATAAAMGNKTLLASVGVGAGFIYGAKNAANLENTFNTTGVLLNSGGENQHEVDKNLNALRESSRNSSIKYGISQQEIVKGFEELTRKGYTSDQLRQIQDTMLKTSIASGDPYSDVVKNGAATVEAYNPKRLNMRKFTNDSFNQMAYIADLTSTDFQKLGYGMSYAGPTAAQAGRNISDTAAALGVLSNQGVEGTAAGTGLRKVINSLVSPTKNGAPILAELGILDQPVYNTLKNGKRGNKIIDYKENTLLDQNGKLLPFNEIFEKINAGMDAQGYNAKDKNKAFNKIFGTTGQTAGFILSQSTGNKQGELGYLSQKAESAPGIDNGKGYISEIADRNMNTAKSQMNRLKEAGTSLATTFAVAVLPAVSKTAEKIADIAEALAKAPKPVKFVVGALAASVPAAAAVSFSVAAISKSFGGIFKLASGLRKITAGFKGWAKNGFKFNKQQTELEKQLEAVKQLTKAINENTTAKERNSNVDLDDGVNGSGRSSKYQYDKNIGRGGKLDHLKNEVGKGSPLEYATNGQPYVVDGNYKSNKKTSNRYSGSSKVISGEYIPNGYTGSRNTTSKNKAKNGNYRIGSTARDYSVNTKEFGKTTSFLSKVKNSKVATGAGNLAKGVGWIGAGMGALDVATSYYGSSDKDRTRNTAGAIGGAIGSSVGMLVPVPVLDLAISAGLGWLGNKIGQKAGDVLEDQKKKIEKQREKDGSNSKKYRNTPGRTNAFSDPTEEAMANNPATKEAQRDFNRIKNRQKIAISQTADARQRRQDKAERKELYDNVGSTKGQKEANSKLLRDFVNDSKKATEAWASNTKGSTKDVQKSYDKMFEDIKKNNQTRITNDKKVYDDLVKQGIISRKTADNNLKNEQTASNKRIANIKKTINEISNSENKGGKDRSSKLRKLNEQLVALTNSGAKKQTEISRRLNKDTVKLNSEQYAKIILQSTKARDKTIANATKATNATIKGADKELQTNIKKIKSISGLTEKQKNDLIDKAKKQRDKVVDNAQRQKEAAVEWARKQHASVVKEAKAQADETTSAIASASGSISKILSNITEVAKGANNYVGQLSRATPKLEDAVVSNIQKQQDIASGKTKVKTNSQIEKDQKKFGFKSYYGALNTHALGGAIAKDETALVNENGEESVYDRKSGLLKLIKGEPGLIQLHAGEEVLSAEQTKKILGNRLKRSEAIRGFANGTGGQPDDDSSVSIQVSTKGFKTSVDDTKNTVDDIQKALGDGYKKASKDSLSQISDFDKNSSDKWKVISKNTSDKVKNLTKDVADFYTKGSKKYSSTLSDFSKNSAKTWKNVSDDTDKKTKSLSKNTESTYKKGVKNYNKSLKEWSKASSDGWNKISKDQNKQTKGIVDNTSKSYKKLSQDTNKNYKQMYDTTSKQTKNMSSVTTKNTKALASNYNQIIGKLPGYARNSMKGAVNALNKGFSGVNSALSQFGGSVKVLSPIRYATGSNGKLDRDQLAMVNDATSGPRQEAIIRNNKIMLPKGNDRILQLSKGDEVLNGHQTEKLMKLMGVTRYAKGSGVSNKRLEKIAEANAKNPAAAWARDFTSKVSVLGSTLQKGITSSIVSGMKQSGTAWYGSMWKLINNTIKSEAASKKSSSLDTLVKKQLGNQVISKIEDKFISTSGMANPSGSSVSRWTAVVKKALQANNLEANNYRVQKILQTIARESNGNPTAVNNWDSNAQAGIPSKGLMQTIGPTFNTYKLPGHNNIMNGYDNTAAAINYIKHRYGTSDAAFARVAAYGYENGGLSTKHKLAEISEKNKPEMVIPLTNKSRSVELIMKSLEYMFGKNGNTSDQSNNNNNDELVQELINQNKEKDKKIDTILSKMDALISVIQSKPVISEANIYSAYNNQQQKYQRFNNLGKGAF